MRRITTFRVAGGLAAPVEHFAVTDDAMADDVIQPFSREVGLRLRAVRRQRRLSLDDVERQSGGRWSASAVGAYERGFRNLSLPRLQELAAFFDVPMSALLGESESRESGRVSGQVVLDLVALESAPPEAAPVLRYARSIVLDRGDWNGRVLSVRREDLRGLASMSGVDERTLIARLEEWGALAEPEPRFPAMVVSPRA